MKEIKTRKGEIIQVSDESFEEMSKHSWYICKGYARTAIRDAGGVWRVKYMSRMIAEAKPGELVDHIDGNTLNNQLENLRLCTQSQNMANRKHPPRSTSGFWGVRKNGNGWLAQIRVNNNRYNLGTFSTAEEAAHIRDEAAIKYFGEFATLNFTDGDK